MGGGLVRTSTHHCAIDGRTTLPIMGRPAFKINMSQRSVAGRSNRYTIDQMRAHICIDFYESTCLP